MKPRFLIFGFFPPVSMMACQDKSDTDTAVDTDSTASAEDTSQNSEMEGGACEYDDYPGVCRVESDGSLTYSGDIGGEAATLAGNSADLPSGQTAPSEGTSLDCTISYITTGTCTPCLLDIGSCGSEAFAYIENLN